jgi:hypothetical protein
VADNATYQNKLMGNMMPAILAAGSESSGCGFEDFSLLFITIDMTGSASRLPTTNGMNASPVSYAEN